MKQIKIILSLITLLGFVAGSKPAVAGPYADELGKCLSRSATSADNITLVKWIFATMALSPDLKDIVSITDSERNVLNQQMGKVFETLVTRSCRTQAKNALQYEGSEGFGSGFGALGETAMTLLYSNPAVAEGMFGFIQYIDIDKLVKVLE